MCGIAGAIDLTGSREPDNLVVRDMGSALRTRVPDDYGFMFAPGFGMGNRRLAIVGETNGRQPMCNKPGTVGVIGNSEFFDYPEQKARLEAKGHVFRTCSDTEIIVHLYEDHGEDMFQHLKGQFAFVLIDIEQHKVLLARDRVGICPLHWSRQGDWLYFGSENKALLALPHLAPALASRGLYDIFTFFAMGTRRTMFAGIQSVAPGHY